MPALIERWTGGGNKTVAAESQRALGFADYMKLVTQFSFNGMAYSSGAAARPGGDFEQMVQSVHGDNNIVASAVTARGLLLKQMRFAWRNDTRNDANYRQLFGNERLRLLERPDPGVLTLPQWLAVSEYHESYGGASFTWVNGGRLVPLAPDHVDCVLMGPSDKDDLMRRTAGRKVGYLFFAEGRDKPEAAIPLKLNEVIHWMPEPHPLMWWTGNSWVGSVLTEVVTDKTASRYLHEHLGNAAMPAMVIKPHEMLDADQIDEYAEKFETAYGGTANAGKTMWLGGGSTIEVVGSKIAELDLKNLTGGGETRIAMRARVPGVILGIRESMQGSSLTQGNYNSARRQWADAWFTPTAQDLCASAESVLPPAPGTRLWYDPADCLFLQEDSADAAAIMASQAAAIRQLVDGGFDPETAVKAVRDNNLTALNHSGLTSVQLLPPGTGEETPNNE